MRRVQFFQATDAFLYLPAYVASHLQIYKSLDPTLQVDFTTPKARRGPSDLLALEKVCSCDADQLPIAICDPCTIFDPRFSDQQFVVLGAMITKAPFWVVDGAGEQTDNELNAVANCDKLIYYNSDLITGNYFGRRIKSHMNQIVEEVVAFGSEFQAYAATQTNGPSAVITCDLVSMAFCSSTSNRLSPRKATGLASPISIRHSYAKNKDHQQFLTTALVTTRKAYSQHKPIVPTILQGIHMSIGLLNASEALAVEICNRLRRIPDFYNDFHKNVIGRALDRAEVQWIVKQLYEGQFYPSNLQITEDQWQCTLECRAMQQPSRELRNKYERGILAYETTVLQEPLTQAQFGICRAFAISPFDLVQTQSLWKRSVVLLPRNLRRFRTACKLACGIGVLCLIVSVLTWSLISNMRDLAVGLAAGSAAPVLTGALFWAFGDSIAAAKYRFRRNSKK